MNETIKFLLALGGIGLLFLGADACTWLIGWLDRRRAPKPLTREQRAARGMEPPWPWHDHDWDDVYEREPTP